MELIIISILIIINGFFSLAEIALISSKPSRLEQMKKEKRAGAETALGLIKNSEKFLSAIQIGITLTGIITGVYGGVSIAENIAPFFENIEILRSSSYEIALSVTVVVITFLSILFGELAPKTIALSNPENIAVRVAPFIRWFSIIFYPVVKLLSASTSFITGMLGIKGYRDHITESEIRQMLKTASHEGIIEKEQNLIHEKVFYFSDKRAKHIMTNRMELEWIDIEETADEIREKIIESTRNRLLCCKKKLDNFIGTLSVKDYLAVGQNLDKRGLMNLLSQPLFVPESAEAYKTLQLFREKRLHFCVVVNEYGSIEGIITPHDILENLIGDIPAEGEKYEPDIYERDDKSLLVSGDASAEILDDIFENYQTHLEDVDYTTVAGFVLSKIDKIPQIGDKVEFNDYIIEIVDVDKKRIDKILIRKK
ncbi:MAG: hemolysin family protein [Bacteroidales bacterium]|jgi:putative hemolysin|nr:hemolysin family protein [Bacteroidales bacterium]